MFLNVIIASYDRASLLRNTLASLCAATPGTNLRVLVTVVDNNSTDDTRETVETFSCASPIEIQYLFEPRQGKSRALNTGIAHSKAELIAFLDDDITVSADWFVEIDRLFSVRWNEIDFAGGKILPRWETQPPVWLPDNLSGVLALQDNGDEEFAYGGSDAELPGCQAVIKRSVLMEVGPYNEELGPSGTKLLRGEDDDMYYRLIQAGKRGLYTPNLVVFHHVPQCRLTKRYFREWFFCWGGSQALLSTMQAKYTGPTIFGVPRYLYGNTVRSAARMISSLFKRDSADYFSNELTFWVLAGFFSRRHNSLLRWLNPNHLRRSEGNIAAR